MQNVIVSSIDEPRALASSLIENLNSQEDLSLVHALIQQQIKTNETRLQILLQAQTALSQIEKECQEMKEKAHQPQRTLEVTRHLQDMTSMQQEESELQQVIQSSDDSLMALTGQLDKLKSELKKLERQEQQENETPPNAEIITLNLYRSLGMDVLQDKETGKFTKCQVRCSDKNDIHTVEMNNDFSKYYYTNLLWELATPGK